MQQIACSQLLHAEHRAGQPLKAGSRKDRDPTLQQSLLEDEWSHKNDRWTDRAPRIYGQRYPQRLVQIPTRIRQSKLQRSKCTCQKYRAEIYKSPQESRIRENEDLQEPRLRKVGYFWPKPNKGCVLGSKQLWRSQEFHACGKDKSSSRIIGRKSIFQTIAFQWGSKSGHDGLYEQPRKLHGRWRTIL